MAVHMRYNSWYISLPSSAQQHQKRPNSALSGEREFYLKLIAMFQIKFQDSFVSDKQSKWI